MLHQSQAPAVFFMKYWKAPALPKGSVNLANCLNCKSKSTFEHAAVDPLLHGNVRLGFELEIALACILAIVILERALDVDRVCIVAFDEVGIVAVHRPHQVGKQR